MKSARKPADKDVKLRCKTLTQIAAEYRFDDGCVNSRENFIRKPGLLF